MVIKKVEVCQNGYEKNLDIMEYKHYKEGQMDKNALSFWYPKVKNIGFRTPKTVIVPLSFEMFRYLSSDDYEKHNTKILGACICKEAQKKGFNTNKELFLKTGNFSGKFTFFESCHVQAKGKEGLDVINAQSWANQEKKLINSGLIPTAKMGRDAYIGEHFLSIWYAGMCVGCKRVPEAVFREFIHTEYDRRSIYLGMKLNTEYRVFYNFTEKKFLGMFNYWDTETMLSALKYSDAYDLDSFFKSIDILERDYELHKSDLEHLINRNLAEASGLDSVWSVDFLWTGSEFVLIDMALAENSYYYDKLSSNIK